LVQAFGLCHFLGRKKCGNLNFVIFYLGKSAESWTLLFLLAKKVRKVELLSFLLAEKIKFKNKTLRND
jgi:hypothetical protein